MTEFLCRNKAWGWARLRSRQGSPCVAEESLGREGVVRAMRTSWRVRHSPTHSARRLCAHDRARARDRQEDYVAKKNALS